MDTQKTVLDLLLTLSAQVKRLTAENEKLLAENRQLKSAAEVLHDKRDWSDE